MPAKLDESIKFDQILKRFPQLTQEHIRQAKNIFSYSPNSCIRYCQCVSKQVIQFPVCPSVSSSFKKKGKKWTTEEENFLSKNWGVLSTEHLCIVLGRKQGTIAIKAMRMGLKFAYPKNWQQHEIDYLVENYGLLTPQFIANKLGRTAQAVRQKFQKLKRDNII